MKSRLLYACFLFFPLAVISQSDKYAVESLNTKLASHFIFISGKDAYYQIRSEELGKKISLDLYYGGEVISKTGFYRNQIDRIETSVSQNGNPVLIIFSNDSKMSYISIPENKQTLIAEQNIPLQSSKEEAQNIKNSLENLLKLKSGKE